MALDKSDRIGGNQGGTAGDRCALVLEIIKDEGVLF